MLPVEAAKYCQQICDKEMPQELKKYIELKLFPHIYMKVRKGILMSMAHCWLQNEDVKGVFTDSRFRNRCENVSLPLATVTSKMRNSDLSLWFEDKLECGSMLRFLVEDKWSELN